MRYQFVLITLALCLQITLLWTLGMRLDTDSGSVAIQPGKVIAPKPSGNKSIMVQAVVSVAEPQKLFPRIVTKKAPKSLQHLFEKGNHDHAIIEQAIRDKLEYDSNKRPEGELTDRMLARITYLDLNRKGLSDIRPLSALINLRQLNLRKNRVDDFSVAETLPLLNALYIRDNPALTKKMIRRAKGRMPNCVIVHNMK